MEDDELELDTIGDEKTALFLIMQTFDEVAACSGSYGLLKEDEFINEFMKG